MIWFGDWSQCGITTINIRERQLRTFDCADFNPEKTGRSEGPWIGDYCGHVKSIVTEECEERQPNGNDDVYLFNFVFDPLCRLAPGLFQRITETRK